MSGNSATKSVLGSEAVPPIRVSSVAPLAPSVADRAAGARAESPLSGLPHAAQDHAARAKAALGEAFKFTEIAGVIPGGEDAPPGGVGTAAAPSATGSAPPPPPLPGTMAALLASGANPFTVGASPNSTPPKPKSATGAPRSGGGAAWTPPLLGGVTAPRATAGAKGDGGGSGVGSPAPPLPSPALSGASQTRTPARAVPGSAGRMVLSAGGTTASPATSHASSRSGRSVRVRGIRQVRGGRLSTGSRRSSVGSSRGGAGGAAAQGPNILETLSIKILQQIVSFLPARDIASLRCSCEPLGGEKWAESGVGIRVIGTWSAGLRFTGEALLTYTMWCDNLRRMSGDADPEAEALRIFPASEEARHLGIADRFQLSQIFLMKCFELIEAGQSIDETAEPLASVVAATGGIDGVRFLFGRMGVLFLTERRPCRRCGTYHSEDVRLTRTLCWSADDDEADGQDSRRSIAGDQLVGLVALVKAFWTRLMKSDARASGKVARYAELLHRCDVVPMLVTVIRKGQADRSWLGFPGHSGAIVAATQLMGLLVPVYPRIGQAIIDNGFLAILRDTLTGSLSHMERLWAPQLLRQLLQPAVTKGDVNDPSLVAVARARLVTRVASVARDAIDIVVTHSVARPWLPNEHTITAGLENPLADTEPALTPSRQRLSRYAVKYHGPRARLHALEVLRILAEFATLAANREEETKPNAAVWELVRRHMRSTDVLGLTPRMLLNFVDNCQGEHAGGYARSEAASQMLRILGAVAVDSDGPHAIRQVAAHHALIDTISSTRMYWDHDSGLLPTLSILDAMLDLPGTRLDIVTCGALARLTPFIEGALTNPLPGGHQLRAFDRGHLPPPPPHSCVGSWMTRLQHDPDACLTLLIRVVKRMCGLDRKGFGLGVTDEVPPPERARDVAVTTSEEEALAITHALEALNAARNHVLRARKEWFAPQPTGAKAAPDDRAVATPPTAPVRKTSLAASVEKGEEKGEEAASEAASEDTAQDDASGAGGAGTVRTTAAQESWLAESRRLRQLAAEAYSRKEYTLAAALFGDAALAHPAYLPRAQRGTKIADEIFRERALMLRNRSHALLKVRAAREAFDAVSAATLVDPRSTNLLVRRVRAAQTLMLTDRHPWASFVIGKRHNLSAAKATRVKADKRETAHGKAGATGGAGGSAAEDEKTATTGSGADAAKAVDTANEAKEASQGGEAASASSGTAASPAASAAPDRIRTISISTEGGEGKLAEHGTPSVSDGGDAATNPGSPIPAAEGKVEGDDASVPSDPLVHILSHPFCAEFFGESVLARRGLNYDRRLGWLVVTYSDAKMLLDWVNSLKAAGIEQSKTTRELQASMERLCMRLALILSETLQLVIMRDEAGEDYRGGPGRRDPTRMAQWVRYLEMVHMKPLTAEEATGWKHSMLDAWHELFDHAEDIFDDGDEEWPVFGCEVAARDSDIEPDEHHVVWHRSYTHQAPAYNGSFGDEIRYGVRDDDDEAVGRQAGRGGGT